MTIKIYTMDTENLNHIADSFFNNEIIAIFQDFSYQPVNSCTGWLDPQENEFLLKFKSDHFKYRFLYSRLALKKLFSYILNEASPSAIELKKRRDGRIVVNGNEDIFISLSYSQNLISISIAHERIGTDLEFIRPFHSDILSRSPVYNSFLSQVQLPLSVRTIAVWTLIEAICKYDGTCISSLLNSSCDVSGFNISMRIIHGKFLFTLVRSSSNCLPVPVSRLFSS